MVAIGGYGRGELNPFSDVDILFLHNFTPERTPQPMHELIKQILYVLWDIGFKVGPRHALDPRGMRRTPITDNISKTALLEARFIAGREELVTDFKLRFDRLCVRGHERAYLDWRQRGSTRPASEVRSRPCFFRSPTSSPAPAGCAITTTCSGARYFRERASNIDQLTERKFINDSERRMLERAYDFLLRVRTDLHYLAKRSSDTLALNFQSQIADRFRYPQNNALRRREAFMRDYYHHARTISLITETLFERLLDSRPPDKTPRGAAGSAALFTSLRARASGALRRLRRAGRADLPGDARGV